MNSLLKFILATIGAAASIVVIYQFISEPSSDLYAEVRFNKLIYPEQFLSAEGELRNQVNDVLTKSVDGMIDEINEFLIKDLEDVPKEEIEKLSYRLSRNKLSTEGDLINLWHHYANSVISERSFIQNILSISIYNEGDESANNVKLFLPKTSYATVYKDNNIVEHYENINSLELGAILPDGKISVSVATIYTTTNHEIEDLKLSHEKGKGDVEYYYHLGLPWSWLHDHWEMLFFVLYLIFLAYLLLTIIIESNKKKGKEQGEIKDDAERDEGKKIEESMSDEQSQEKD